MTDSALRVAAEHAPCLVIDTNIVLDLWLFHDPRSAVLREALEAGWFRWVTTEHMLAELAHVLRYPHLIAWMQRAGLAAADVLAEVERHAHLVAAAPYAMVRCKDRDDQVFIDLAVAHRATLISKDRAVLKLRRALSRLGVAVHAQVDALPVGHHT